MVLTYHSSSLMPGGSPYARSPAERDGVLRTLTQYIAYFTSLPSWATDTVAGLATTMRAERPV